MGLITNVKIAKRSLTRRKTKNLSAILAIALGVTLMVGIQITTATLEETFLTSLLLTEGETDFRISNGTGSYLSADEIQNISDLVQNEVGIMPELRTVVDILVGSQFESDASLAGIPLNYSDKFGTFYDWKTGEEMNISTKLVDNTTILLSSNLARDLKINKTTELPLTVRTVFVNSTYFPLPINATIPVNQQVNFSITGIYDSKRPGIGASYRGALLSLEGLQDWVSLADENRNKDIISTYLIALQTNHFNNPIQEDYLQEQFDLLEDAIPEKMILGTSVKIYAVDSPRLLYFDIVGIIFTMMSAFLNVLGMLIIITGILLITNVQLMSVEDREFQTGVFRAVGERRRGIFLTMLIETLFQGVIGGLLGLFGGLAFGQIVAVYLAGLFGSGSASVQPVIKESVVVFSVIVGVILGIITGLLPALRASRVNIVEALRGIKIVTEEKSSRNFALIGYLLSFVGIFFLLNNGLLNTDLQYIWGIDGWDNVDEWVNILLGAGFLFTGLGIILSRYIRRNIAFNITAFVLWATPVFMFLVAFSQRWITDMAGMSFDLLIIALIEVIIGSVMIVGLNLMPLMQFLRGTLIKISGIKGVAQIAPALVSSHAARATLTFAIFAVVLTLNVTVASLVATNISSTVGQSEEDSRGIDLYVTLSNPEVKLNTTSYTEELYKLDEHIIDVIGFKTFTPGLIDIQNFVATKNPYDPTSGFNPYEHLLPLGYVELRSDQIRGNASSAEDDNWRYDFYLGGLPDGVRKPGMTSSGGFMGGGMGGSEYEDEELLYFSRQGWDAFFNSSYYMTAYNVTFDLAGLEDIDIASFSERFSNDLYEEDPLLDNNSEVIKNPIVFTDSFMLPLGMQIYVPMNITLVNTIPTLIYQPFTIGGILDSERAGGFPLSTFNMQMGFSSDSFSTLGNIYLPERYANFTSYLAKASGVSPTQREPNEYDSYLIKTDYAFDHLGVSEIAKKIEEFTNTEDFGYRKLAGDDFIVATATSVYSDLKSELEMMEQMTSFLQIYVNFGLIIGAVGMAVISVRNVAERKREIGMMRAIGFPRYQVMLTALLELFVLGFIGLIIGVVNGLIVNIGFSHMMDAPAVIPWGTISAYLFFITFIGLLAGAIPGWVASRIPAAEALRYVG